MVQVHLGPPYQRSFLLRYGDLAQLVEHLLCKQGVRGSIPLVSTGELISTPMNNFAEEYRAATEQFLNLVHSLKSSDLDKSDSDGWTPRQIIHHLADSEAQSYARLRRLIAEPGSIIQGYNENKWAESPTLGYTT